MAKTLTEFITYLESYKEKYGDKEIIVVAPNGLHFEPSLKLVRKDKHDVLNFSKENIEKLVIE